MLLKYIRMFQLLGILLIYGCGELKADRVRKFIPGTYIRFSEHEFGKEYDTLVVSEAGGQFQIQRRWLYERILDGLLLEPEYKLETTTAIYDAKNQVLHENETGNMVSFDEKEKTLYVGKTKYNKLK